MGKKLFFSLLAFLCITIAINAQEKKFSIQFNTGYTWFSGAKMKVNNPPENISFGSFINGQIPLEAELRYKINPRFSLNFAYGYGVSLPYQADGNKLITGKTPFVRSNLSTHTLRIGEVYYFTTTKARPYIGLDLALLLSQLVEKRVGSTEIIDKSKIFATFGLLPKVGVEYSLNERLFLNCAIHYTLVVQTNIFKKGDNVNTWYNRDQQVPSHGVGLNLGVGYRF